MKIHSIFVSTLMILGTNLPLSASAKQANLSAHEKQAFFCMESAKTITDDRARAKSSIKCFRQNYLGLEYDGQTYEAVNEEKLHKLSSQEVCMQLADMIEDYSQFHPIYYKYYYDFPGFSRYLTSYTDEVKYKERAKEDCVYLFLP